MVLATLKREECEVAVSAALGSPSFDLVDWSGSSSSGDGTEAGISLDSPKRQRNFKDEDDDVIVARVKEDGSGSWTVIRLVVSRDPKVSAIYHDLLVPLGKPNGIYPKPYLVREDLLVTEYVEGCRTNHNPWNEEELEMALAAVARLHAASLVSSHVPEKYRRETIFTTDPDTNEFQNLCGALAAIEGILEVYYAHMSSEVIERSLKMMRSGSERLSMVDERSRVRVVSHGAVWNRTVAFSQNTGSAVFVRWNTAKVSAPAWDVLHAIYASGAGQAPLQARLIHYFNALSRCLASSDRSVHGLMTWAQFEESAADMEPVLLSLVPLFLATELLPGKIMRFASSSASANMSSDQLTSACLDAMRTSDSYRKRISHSLHNLFEYIGSHPQTGSS